jgi:hypothetical protein
MFGRRASQVMDGPNGQATACLRHPFEHAEASCSRCASVFCDDCLVRPFGRQRQSICIGCALIVAGVRH